MGLSVEKFSDFLVEIPAEAIHSIKLSTSLIVAPDGTSKAFRIEDWPLLVFLRGLGCENIDFKGATKAEIETWAVRMSQLEHLYIEDPDSLNLQEAKWNELRDQTPIIECRWVERKLTLHEVSGESVIPPLEAPLGILEEARLAFVAEVKAERARDTLKRFLMVIKEFEASSQSNIESQIKKLVMHFGILSLQHKALDLTIELVSMYPTIWETATSDLAYSEKVFKSFDPRPSEFVEWSKLFQKIPHHELLTLLANNIGSTEENKLTKLLQYRSLQDPDSYVGMVWDADSSIQKILLKVLITHWTEAHFDVLYSRFLDTLSDESLAKSWLTAALKASSPKLLQKIEESFFKRKIFGKPKFIESGKGPILDVLADHMTIDIANFLKKHAAQFAGVNKKKVDLVLLTYKRKNAL